MASGMPIPRVTTPPMGSSKDARAATILRASIFFFQAEDGIRDYKVTGVQTCALPISKNLKGRAPAIVCFYGTTSGAGKDTTVGLSGPTPGSPPVKNRGFAVDMVEIGRASCRERV